MLKGRRARRDREGQVWHTAAEQVVSSWAGRQAGAPLGQRPMPLAEREALWRTAVEDFGGGSVVVAGDERVLVLGVFCKVGNQDPALCSSTPGSLLLEQNFMSASGQPTEVGRGEETRQIISLCNRNGMRKPQQTWGMAPLKKKGHFSLGYATVLKLVRNKCF